MLLSKNTIKKRLMNHNEICLFCKSVISFQDITENNFEYTENRLHKNYFHKTCYDKEVRKNGKTTDSL